MTNVSKIAVLAFGALVMAAPAALAVSDPMEPPAGWDGPRAAAPVYSAYPHDYRYSSGQYAPVTTRPGTVIENGYPAATYGAVPASPGGPTIYQMVPGGERYHPFE